MSPSTTPQRRSADAVALAMVLALLCVVAQATYTTRIAGCLGPTQYTLKIDSALENEAAAAFLRRESLSEAGLAGYVMDGQPYWDDGSEVSWRPSSFQLPTSANGFLTLRSDGSWRYLLDYAYFITPFLCSDGKLETEPPTTSTPTSSTVAPPTDTSTTAPTSTLAPNTTTTITPSTVAPTVAPAVNVADVVAALQAAFNAAGTIAVSTHTANAVQIPAATAGALLRQLNNAYGTVYLGIGECNPQTLSAQSVAALVASPETAEVGFYLPYTVAAAATATTTQTLCLMGHRSPASSSSTMAPPASFAPLAATLKVVSIAEVMAGLHGTVAVNYVDTLDSMAHTKSLTITGAGTATPYTTELSPSFFRGFTFSLVNNGITGRECTPSSNAVPFLMARNTLQLTLSATNVKLIANGGKSICAAYAEGTNTVVVARLTQTALLATAVKAKYTYGTPIPARVRGVSTNSLAKGRVTAFVTASAQCSTAGSTPAMLEVSLSSDAGPAAPSATGALVPQLFVTAPVSAAGSAKFVCLTYTPARGGSGTSFPLVTAASAESAAPIPVAVTGTATRVVPTKLTVFNSMEGSVMLTKYVTAVSSHGDQANYDAVMTLLSGKAPQYVRFVPMRLNAGTTPLERADTCRRAASAAEVTTTVQAGVLSLTSFTSLSQPTGVLCVGEAYIRVDYAVVEPTTWLRTLGATTDFSSSAFVLSITPASGFVGDAAPLTFAGSEYHSDMALRFSSTGDCTVGNAALVRTYDDGTRWVVALPGSGLGTYTVCIGLYSLDAGADHAAFASTGRTISLATYAVALSNWKANVGIAESTWTSCGGLAACGVTTTQQAKQVCPTSLPTLDTTRTGAVVRTWPSRLADEVNYLGAFVVRMRGNGVTALAGAFLGIVYTAPANADAHCQQYSLLEMSSDMASYSTSVVATMNRPFVSFKPTSQLTGATVGLAPWDQECTAQNVRLRTVASDNTFVDDSNAGEWGNSTFDVSPLLYANAEGYYRLCYPAGNDWHGVSLSYVKVIRDRLTDGVQIEAIGTGNPADNRDTILLWQTQSATWYVTGEFDSTVAVSLVLVWDDATCQATAAFTTPVLVDSTTGGHVNIDTTLIADPPATPVVGAAHSLYPCFTTALSAHQRPLSFEARRNRRITLSPLSLSSINYLPHYAISYQTEGDTSIQITGPHRPPITQVTLFFATSLDDREATTARCSITSQNFVMTLPAMVDGFGMRWVVVPSSVPRMVGIAGREVYLLLCATASTAANPPFEPVDAYVAVNKDGMDEANDVYLDLTFAPLNLSTDVLESEGAKSALAAYAAAVVPGVAAAQVWVSNMGYNHFALYVEPQGPVTDVSPTAALYEALAAGTQLPVRAQSTVNMSYFVLFSAEGRRLRTQSSHAKYPYVKLRISAGETTVTNGAAFSIALFCIIVTPTVVGFVIFSLQRTIPSLTHKKKSHEEGGATVYGEAGDSPPPRNPRMEFPVDASEKDGKETADYTPTTNAAAGAAAARPASQMDLVVEPNAEDTAANPLYDDSEEDAHPTDDETNPVGRGVGAMGASPPLRNATFAMSGGKGLSTPSAASSSQSS